MRIIFGLLLSLLLTAAIAAGGTIAYLLPRLPSIATLKDVRLQVPLRVYTQDRSLIAEFGEKRRNPIKLNEAPPLVLKAILAAEDDRFYDHHGVDLQSMARAILQLVRTGEKSQGGSTITMQVARNFFLSPEKTFLRKVNEILLALKIEGKLSKDEILELYLNKIYLGQRAYGVAAAAQAYYGVDLKDLTLPQIAMIAGLPKAPSQINPVVDPTRATERRNYVLGRMLDRGYIDRAAHAEAIASVDNAAVHVRAPAVEAAYVAEMVRSYMVERYGEAIYEAGYRVVTTVTDKLQTAANDSLQSTLLEYDRRHGYRGPERRLSLPRNAGEADWRRLLQAYSPVAGILPALAITVGEKTIAAFAQDVGMVQLGADGLKILGKGDAGKSLKGVFKPGDVIRLQWAPKGYWRLTQVPEVEGALVAVDPNDGAVRALVGGFDFNRSKFNRVTQGHRQPGSGFKPFIYSAALDAGFTAASVLDDAPLEIWDPALDTFWRPENYTHTFRGPTRLRVALAHSRNLVSIRLLQGLSMDKALKHVGRFGFDVAQQPRNLSLVLGTGSVTPLDLAAGYTVFANGGYRVFPYFIQQIEDDSGNPVMQAMPPTVCDHCTETGSTNAAEPETGGAATVQASRVISSQNAWLMNSMLQDVVKVGTAKAALALNRNDLAGKTGTTNDQRDAWFTGYNTRLVATAWLGFDQTKALGDKETGAHAALPMWMKFMRVALAGVPDAKMPEPDGIVRVRIDRDTGFLTSAGNPRGIFEYFSEDTVPVQQTRRVSGEGAGAGTDIGEQLF